jgi:hypothetical protein
MHAGVLRKVGVVCVNAIQNVQENLTWIWVLTTKPKNREVCEDTGLRKYYVIEQGRFPSSSENTLSHRLVFHFCHISYLSRRRRYAVSSYCEARMSWDHDALHAVARRPSSYGLQFSTCCRPLLGQFVLLYPINPLLLCNLEIHSINHKNSCGQLSSQ